MTDYARNAHAANSSESRWHPRCCFCGVMSDIVRKEFPSAQRLPEGPWAVVASLRHHSDYGEKTIDLPVPEETFESQPAAEDFGARLAMEWLDRNAPRAA